MNEHQAATLINMLDEIIAETVKDSDRWVRLDSLMTDVRIAFNFPQTNEEKENDRIRGGY